MNPEQIEQIKQLFQRAYDVFYSEGKFDLLVEDAENRGAAAAVSALAGTFVSKVVQEGASQDLDVLFALGTLIVTDLINSLAETGIEATEEDIQKAISDTVTGVMAENPEFAQSVMQNQDVMAIMNQVTGGEQAAAPAEAAPAETEGVL